MNSWAKSDSGSCVSTQAVEEGWFEVLDLAIKAGNTEIQEKVEKQIRKINEKLKF